MQKKEKEEKKKKKKERIVYMNRNDSVKEDKQKNETFFAFKK